MELRELAKKMNGFKLKIDSPDLEREIAKELLDDIGRIQSRTLGGRDKNDRAFTAYSPDYKKAKDETGRVVRRDAPTRGATVNLWLSGAMLGALKSKVIHEGKNLLAQIFISGDEATIAGYHIRGDGVPKRDFLGFTKQFYKNIKRIVKKAFTNG